MFDVLKEKYTSVELNRIQSADCQQVFIPTKQPSDWQKGSLLFFFLFCFFGIMFTLPGFLSLLWNAISFKDPMKSKINVFLTHKSPLLEYLARQLSLYFRVCLKTRRWLILRSPIAVQKHNFLTSFGDFGETGSYFTPQYICSDLLWLQSFLMDIAQRLETELQTGLLGNKRKFVSQPAMVCFLFDAT